MGNRRPHRPTHFETVMVEEALRLAKQQRSAARGRNGDGKPRGRRKTDGKVAAGKHILSISYDVALLASRQMLLEGRGYQVTSVVGLEAATAACRRSAFDLAILGHSIPPAHKRQMLDLIRAAHPAPVLALLRAGEPPLGAGADHAFNPIEGPRAFLDIVQQILNGDRAAN